MRLCKYDVTVLSTRTTARQKHNATAQRHNTRQRRSTRLGPRRVRVSHHDIDDSSHAGGRLPQASVHRRPTPVLHNRSVVPVPVGHHVRDRATGVQHHLLLQPQKQ